MPTDRKQVSHRIKPETDRLLEALADKLGLSKTAVIEMAIRKLARQEGVK